MLSKNIHQIFVTELIAQFQNKSGSNVDDASEMKVPSRVKFILKIDLKQEPLQLDDIRLCLLKKTQELLPWER